MKKYMKLKTVIMKKSAQRRTNYRTDPTFISTLKSTGKKSTTLIVDLFSKMKGRTVKREIFSETNLAVQELLLGGDTGGDAVES